MPIKSKWILTLGILAMSPSLVMAKGPFNFSGLSKSANSAETASSAKTNQDVALEIAAALRQARLVGYDINIEYKNGTAVLSGMIQDSSQKALADKLARSVPEVKNVDNRMGLITPDAGQEIQPTAFEEPVKNQPEVEQAGYQASPQNAVATAIMQTSGEQPQATSAKQNNQQVANSIAQSLKDSGMSGYDIEVSYKNGVAGLTGAVVTPEQAHWAGQVVGRVPGVQSVNNQLQVMTPVAQTAAYQPQLAPGSEMMQAPMPAMVGGYPQGPGGYPPMPMPTPPMMGHGGPGPVNPVYNQPYLPEHSWPTYAAYPNYAAVTYPKQYSASAFPYIGPFYPYPQVPLGWRSSTLEWDDGQWQLTFSPKTDRWWWFMNPKNWD